MKEEIDYNSKILNFLAMTDINDQDLAAKYLEENDWDESKAANKYLNEINENPNNNNLINDNIDQNNIFNDLEEVSLSMSKDLNELYSLLKQNGYKPFISGSGPSMFILNPTVEDIKKIRSLLPENTYLALCHTKQL